MTLPTKERLLELAERCEKASSASRELDAKIATACGIQWSADEDGQYGGYGIMPLRCRFSESLDAALTLVPEKWGWGVGQSDGFKAWAEIHRPDRQDFAKDTMWPGHRGKRGMDATTPALALCAVSLRARASMTVDESKKG